MSVHQFHRRPSNEPMAAVSWQESLDLARSEPEVVKVVRDYVASLNPSELGLLPAHCRPGKFFSAEDITSFAFDVVRYHCGDDQEQTRELVHKLAAFFSSAATRLSRIMARASDSNAQVQSA